MQAPAPAADVCTQRVDLLRMMLNFAYTTDQDKYNDVLESVQNWHDLDMRAFVQKKITYKNNNFKYSL